MTRRRLCVIIPGFFDGGAQRQCIYLLNELQGRDDWDVHLIRFSDGVHDGLLRQDNLTIHELPLQSNYDFRVLVKLLPLLRKLKPDILMSWLQAADVYSFAARRLLPGTRWVMTERDSAYTNEFRFRLRRMLGRYADAIIANSAAGDAYWQRHGAKGKRFVVGNIMRPVPASRPSSSLMRRAIHIGRLEPQKNVVTVARTACMVAHQQPDFEFLFIGEGSLRPDIEAVIAESGVGERVRLEGFHRDIDPYLTSASVLVTLSHHEGLPNALMEATAASVPIVASAIPEHKALLGSDYPYYVTDEDDAQAAATVLEQALDDPDAARYLAEARRLVGAMTPAAVANSYVGIFESLLRERS